MIVEKESLPVPGLIEDYGLMTLPYVDIGRVDIGDPRPIGPPQLSRRLLPEPAYAEAPHAADRPTR
jgi:hypothetical protein